MKNRLITLILRLLLLLLVFSNCAAAADMEIGRMRVAIWPEYDDPGVLVIYDGRFVDDGNFPAETSFFLPQGAIISDACSLSPKGQHFCQLFKQENIGDMEEIRLKLPYPNFYLSFHIDPFEGDGSARDLLYKVRTNHRIRKLEIDIQEPLRAEGFVLTPEAHKLEEAKGFRHYRYYMNKPKKGADIPFKIKYRKDDKRPSVNIKYSPMSMSGGEDGMSRSPHEERGDFVKLLYILAAAGLSLVLVLLWFVFRKKKV
ncbi:MAG: hypothetical protein IMF07_04480 [Proteobacteria bacterium]|nr:hypothetical protein [Pseudomonadota bacterium]